MLTRGAAESRKSSVTPPQLWAPAPAGVHLHERDSISILKIADAERRTDVMAATGKISKIM